MNVDSLVQAVVLGIVQGLTEFIPVSSSAHVTLTPILFDWEPVTTTFVLFVHLGTLLSLLAYFRKDLWKYFKVALYWVTKKGQLSEKVDRENFNVVLMIILAAIPAGIVGLLLDDAITNFYDDPSNQKTMLLALLLAMGAVGVIFIFSDKLFRNNKKIQIKKLTPLKGFLIGLSQVFAFARGVSRSGATLITGQFAGLNRVSAAEFSFLISIPILVGTSAIGIINIAGAPAEEVKFALVGMVSAAISGYLAIRFMLSYLRNNGLQPFGWYRVIFAILVMVILFY